MVYLTGWLFILYVLQLNSRHWLISNASMTIELTSLCKAVVLFKMSELDLAICMVYIENKSEPQWRKQNWRKKGLGTHQLKAVFFVVFFVCNTDLACAGEICGNRALLFNQTTKLHTPNLWGCAKMIGILLALSNVSQQSMPFKCVWENTFCY